MKYLLIDTNVFLDMIIDRKNNFSSALLKTFIKLLDYDEITLLLPSIVVHETYKHIDDELSKVGIGIKNAMKAIGSIYGINGCTIDGLDVKEFKKRAKESLHELNTIYDSKLSQYSAELTTIIKNLFEHRNSIIVEDTSDLRSACLKRKIYKIAPFHHKNKDCFADAMIVETLLNIKNIIELQADDRIYLVTGNTSDFCVDVKSEILHDDILKDIEKNGLSEQIIFIRHFEKLIGKDLSEEVNNASLKEEFEYELKEQEEIDSLEFYYDMLDISRKSVGLSSLGSYEEKFIEEFRESEFADKIVAFSKRIKKCYNNLEELNFFYTDDLINHVLAMKIADVLPFVEKWNTFMDDTDIEGSVNDLLAIVEHISEKATKLDYSGCTGELLDCFDYGDTFCFYNENRKLIGIKMDELCLSCDDGGEDTLCLELYGSDKPAQGFIKLEYGYVTYNDEGNIDESYNEGIMYYVDEIVDELEKIVSAFEKYVLTEQETVEKLKNI